MTKKLRANADFPIAVLVNRELFTNFADMETIYDHNVKKEELEALFGPIEWPKEYCETYSQEDNYIDIYRLYTIRKDTTTAKQYLNKISDTNYKLFSLCHNDF